MTRVFLITAFVVLAGCTKTTLTPQAYMPAPPELLMRAPKELNTIKDTSAKVSNDKR